MGYTSVHQQDGPVAAAARLAREEAAQESTAAALPLLVEQVCAEAGVHEPAVAARALAQARGDTARAVSLLRAWAAILERRGTCRLRLDDLDASRRITPGFRDPAGGQFLGASADYEQRLLDFGDGDPEPEVDASNGGGRVGGPVGGAGPQFPRALAALEAEGRLRAEPAAEPEDVTRTPSLDPARRGALAQLLARGETGALTALAYTAIRGHGARQDPTLAELRVGRLPVRVTHPATGGDVTVGHVPATVAEVALYRLHDDKADPRLTVGIGATLGRVERRAIAAAVLDASCARAADEDHKPPSEDAEFLAIVLDGQEASGFVEHLKLPHYVTFTSDLDRIRTADP